MNYADYHVYVPIIKYVIDEPARSSSRKSTRTSATKRKSARMSATKRKSARTHKSVTKRKSVRTSPTKRTSLSKSPRKSPSKNVSDAVGRCFKKDGVVYCTYD